VQEGAERGGRLQRGPEDASRATRPQGVRVVDRVIARERTSRGSGHFVPDVRPAGCRTKVEVRFDQLTQQAIVVKGRVEAVEAVR
jgi:hypothetical protein